MEGVREDVVRQNRLTGVILGLAIAIANFLLMPADRMPGDPVSWFSEARAIARGGRLCVDESYAEFGEPGQFFVRNPSDGRLYSKYGIASSVVVLPPVALGRALDATALQELFLVNSWQALMTGVLAWLIYTAAGLHYQGRASRILYILCCFYASFAWFYLRAQGTELYQMIYFTAWYIAIVQVLWLGKSSVGRWTWIAWICALLLVHTRPVYALIVPLTFGLLVWQIWRGETYRRAEQSLLRTVLPSLLIAISFAAVSAWKFGAWYRTGYHAREGEHLQLWHVPDAWGFITDPKFSVLIAFPALAVSLAGAYKAWRERCGSYLLVIAIAVIFALVVSAFGFWSGEVAEGPRYMLFVLPVLALPCVGVFEDLAAHRKTLPGIAGTILLIGVLVGSVLNWANLISRPTFAWYRLAAGTGRSMNIDAARFVLSRPRGQVLQDLYRSREHIEYHPFLMEIEPSMTAEQFQQYCLLVRKLSRPDNFYFARYAPYER